MKVVWIKGTVKKDITGYTESVEWSGSDTQASRTVTLSVVYNPYKNTVLKINPGDLVCLMDDICIFYGVTTSTEWTGEIGTVSCTVKDFMHYLLRSTGSYNFKNTTAEKITQKICDDLQIGTSGLYRTGIHLKSVLFEDVTYYRMIVDSYNMAARRADEKYPPVYMPVMHRTKLGVVIKGQSSGVTLKSDADITASEYAQNTDDMVNLVRMTDENGNQTGLVKNEKKIRKYGIYQSIYRIEKDVDAKKAAGQLLRGITKEASVEAVGYRQCIAGYSVQIKDAASGLTGKFYIESDRHTWKDGVHTMSLTLKFDNELEET